MKTWQKWLLGISIALVGIIGLGVIYQMNKQAQLKEEMIKIVESDEAKALFEEEFKHLDPNALTEDGLIKTYEVDYDSFNKNPMGGFSVRLNINGEEEINTVLHLGVYHANGKLEIGGVQRSSKFRELIGE